MSCIETASHRIEPGTQVQGNVEERAKKNQQSEERPSGEKQPNMCAQVCMWRPSTSRA